VFSGNLGYHGGQADLDLLDKVRKARELKPTIEIGWDGGINDQNAREIAIGDIDMDAGGERFDALHLFQILVGRLGGDRGADTDVRHLNSTRLIL
jgi:hypothetical protein